MQQELFAKSTIKNRLDSIKILLVLILIYQSGFGQNVPRGTYCLVGCSLSARPFNVFVTDCERPKVEPPKYSIKTDKEHVPIIGLVHVQEAGDCVVGSL